MDGDISGNLQLALSDAGALRGSVDVNSAVALDSAQGAVRTGGTLSQTVGEPVGVSATLTSADQSVPSATQTVVAFDTARHGDAGALDTSTGEFIAPRGGNYRLDWQAHVINHTGTINAYVETDSGAGRLAQRARHPNPNSESYPVVSATADLAAGDRLWAQVYAAESDGVDISATAAQTHADFWRV